MACHVGKLLYSGSTDRVDAGCGVPCQAHWPGSGQLSRLPYIVARFCPSGSVVQKEVGLLIAFTFRGASSSEQVSLSFGPLHESNEEALPFLTSSVSKSS